MASEFGWLGALRHGESFGNVAADRAEAAGAEEIDIDVPDHEVALTPLGVAQARAVGEWWAGRPADSRPGVLVASSYRRAWETARLAAAAIGVPVAIDERLRDRELGILDRLTSIGVAARFPGEADRRARLGRFYHRPPGGESWADVALRLRAVLADLRADHGGRRVLLVTHEAVIFLCRYLIEDLSVADVGSLSRRRLANAGLTSWVNDRGRLDLTAFDDTGATDAMSTRQEHV